MRPTYLGVLVVALLVEIGVLVAAFGFWIASDGGEPWHYWIAPLLALQAAGLLLMLAFGYWWQIGRVEARGRRRSG